MSTENYIKIAQLKSVEAFQQRSKEIGAEIPIDKAVLTAAEASPMAQSIFVGGFEVGNRWCIHPMEGWDANTDGSPTERTIRRWHNFGISGAKFIWGGEAAAVQADGRANPNQTLATPENEAGLKLLLDTLLAAHRANCGESDDLLVGLQLTHSGRFCRPNSKTLEPRIAYHHPLLDPKFGIDPSDDSIVWTDNDLETLISNYVASAKTAERCGYQFVDIKCCHGYLLHEFLSARTRAGQFGGDYDGRTRLLRTIIQRVQESCPNLMVVVRLSLFDTPPFVTSRDVGKPMDYSSLLPYDHGFGVDSDHPMQMDLDEPLRLIGDLESLGVASINLSCASPYYNPHIMRPAIFPPSDGYLPPEDPITGVARQLEAVRKVKQVFPSLPLVGTGYSYLQDYLPHVAQAAVRENWVDIVGLGRMVLSYPTLPADTLKTGIMQRKKVCRTFSDCTTAPRNGLVSGCYPLDAFYKQTSEFEQLKAIKQGLKES